MVTFKDKQIFIDDQPIFLLSGEMHYFRQPKENWQHLIDEAKAMGLNCISSYVPWILHEEREGEYNFEDNLDLGAFIDLCQENGLYFFVRPGPYIMAEMKKEGIPYWVAKKHPEAIPVGFDGQHRAGNTLDYLHPGYLAECRRWYQKVIQVIVPRLHRNGGNIIGVQLDNEVGMLSWVTNHPVLNGNVLLMMKEYLKEHFSEEELLARYPFWNQNDEAFFTEMRSPEESYSLEFHEDFGKFMRVYYARYIKELKNYAEECGVCDTPFFVNIHGTGSSRIFGFPLGISQLYEAYNQDEGLISGTDVYLGEPTEGKYQDLYVINALTDVMNRKGNPLTSIEFESSDGPYCSLNGMRFHPSATSHKMLMCLSQNARMLSFYVFSGGENFLLKHPENDGNERMAFTGELHGFNAPVQPDGTHNYSFDHIADTAKSIHALNGLIASSRQVLDNVSMAFIPDYFLTEAVYPKSAKMQEKYQNLKRLRCEGQIDTIGRALLGHHISFDAADIQHNEINPKKVLAVLSAGYMAADIQQKLADFVSKGGKLILYGEIPEYDMEGTPCAILRDAMQLPKPSYLQNDEPTYYLSVRSCGDLAEVPMQRAEYAQVFPSDDSAILKIYGKDLMCGMIRQIGQGIICAVTADYPAQMQFWKNVFEKLGIRAGISAPYYRQGIYLAQTESEDGQKLIYLVNLDCVDKEITIRMNDDILFENFKLKNKSSLILPVNVNTPSATIRKSTAEIVGIDENHIVFRRNQERDEIHLFSDKKVMKSPEYEIWEKNSEFVIKFNNGINREICISFENR